MCFVIEKRFSLQNLLKIGHCTDVLKQVPFLNLHKCQCVLYSVFFEIPLFFEVSSNYLPTLITNCKVVKWMLGKSKVGD